MSTPENGKSVTEYNNDKTDQLGKVHRSDAQLDSRKAAPLLAAPPGMLRRTIATLDPGYFALVMGSGIVSVGTDLLGFALISRIILAVTIVGFAVLLTAYLARAIWFWPWFVQSLRDPTTAMAYFTVVAGSNVLGIRLLMAGHQVLTIVLGAFASIVWLMLTYGLPSFIIASARRPILREINGTWLIWVVATQSLAISASGVAGVTKIEGLASALPTLAVCLWSVGVMLYLILIVIIFFRLLLVEVTPSEMGPAYWIAMGATAISVRAAAGILLLHGPHAVVIVNDMRPFLIGLSVVFWSFGSWWIPLLVLFGLWRYLLRGYSREYEPRLWSVVFPLGMYTVASFTLGSVAKLDFMTAIARVWVWIGVFAWAGLLISMLLALIKAKWRPQQAAG
ncbi:MAG: tellurite resistance protein permease [Actinomycetota bacterium]|nr:MAG: tellurite resistance protein permease [Actinomycetota bacterium]